LTTRQDEGGRFDFSWGFSYVTSAVGLHVPILRDLI
jgi:hypothetical protein